jgi:hypothetical protein
MWQVHRRRRRRDYPSCRRNSSRPYRPRGAESQAWAVFRKHAKHPRAALCLKCGTWYKHSTSVTSNLNKHIGNCNGIYSHYPQCQPKTADKGPSTITTSQTLKDQFNSAHTGGGGKVARVAWRPGPRAGKCTKGEESVVGLRHALVSQLHPSTHHCNSDLLVAHSYFTGGAAGACLHGCVNFERTSPPS